MRRNYTCIGACIDIEGLALVRFDLVDTHFRILKTITFDSMPPYDRALKSIEQLAALETDQSIQSIDVLSNFGSSLKNFIINNQTSQHVIRLKTTPVSDDKQNMILNLINISNQNRIMIEETDQSSINAIRELPGMSKKKLKEIYEGNLTLSHVLEAILHSICWLEGQMIKHRMI